MPELTRRALLRAGAAASAPLALGAASSSASATKPRRPSATTLLPDPKTIEVGDPADLDALDCASLLRARKLSSVELTKACLARIEKRNGGLNAFVRVYPELALELAAAADRRLSAAARKKAGRAAPLVCGIPLGLKDLYAVEGLPLTASSKVLRGNVAKGDSTVWRRLRYFGMVLVGHTHTHEFAYGTTTPQTANPWKAGVAAGGSSGGSASALAARTIPAATGSDTGGSLRIPATACGVSSIKPTYGLVSAHGVIPLSWSLDHAGPMARSAASVALLLGYMAGADPGDPASLAPPSPPATYPLRPRAGARPLAGTRVGVPVGATSGADAEASALFERFLGELRGLGAELVEFAEPVAAETLALTLLVDAGAYHAQFADRAADYTPEVAALVAASRAAASGPAGAYLQAQRDRTRYVHAWNGVFTEKRLSAIVKPGAYKLGIPRDAPLGLTPDSLLTATDGYVWADYAGLPVVMTPAGRGASSGLPFGVQVGGPPNAEVALLQMAVDYQARHPHWREAPAGLP